MRRGLLLSAAGASAGATTYLSAGMTPDIPWWGHLIMVLVTAALSFFGGRSQQSE